MLLPASLLIEHPAALFALAQGSPRLAFQAFQLLLRLPQPFGGLFHRPLELEDVSFFLRDAFLGQKHHFFEVFDEEGAVGHLVGVLSPLLLHGVVCSKQLFSEEVCFHPIFKERSFSNFQLMEVEYFIVLESPLRIFQPLLQTVLLGVSLFSFLPPFLPALLQIPFQLLHFFLSIGKHALVVPHHPRVVLLQVLHFQAPSIHLFSRLLQQPRQLSFFLLPLQTPVLVAFLQNIELQLELRVSAFELAGNGQPFDGVLLLTIPPSFFEELLLVFLVEIGELLDLSEGRGTFSR